MKKVIFVLLIVYVNMICSCIKGEVETNDMKVTEDKAIAIAETKAKRYGYNLKNMIIEITKYNTMWDSYIPENSKDELYIELKDKLKDREYWAVYYRPDPKKVGKGHKGGDFTIFIDSKSGEVITDIRWK